MTAFHGMIGKVFENETKSGKPYLSAVIEVDDHGEGKFNVWDTDLFDPVRELEGARVIFERRLGKEKDDGTRFPATITLIQAEEHEPTPHVKDLVEEIEAEAELEADVDDDFLDTQEQNARKERVQDAGTRAMTAIAELVAIIKEIA